MLEVQCSIEFWPTDVVVLLCNERSTLKFAGKQDCKLYVIWRVIATHSWRAGTARATRLRPATVDTIVAVARRLTMSVAHGYSIILQYVRKTNVAYLLNGCRLFCSANALFSGFTTLPETENVKHRKKASVLRKCVTK